MLIKLYLRNIILIFTGWQPLPQDYSAPGGRPNKFLSLAKHISLCCQIKST